MDASAICRCSVNKIFTPLTPFLMKRFLLFGLLISLGATGWLSPAATAQSWRPFGPARTYHYRETDSLYTFRVDSVGLAASGDTVYYFNATSPLTSMYPTTPLSRRNVFGGWLRWSAATGEARINSSASGRTVLLRPRAVVGSSWVFESSTGVTATVAARGMSTVLGQRDSVATVILSTGDTLRLAKRLGLVSGPSFDSFLGQTYLPQLRARALTLAGLPEAGVLGADLRWESIWDWQPGDQFFYADSMTFEDFNVMNPQPSASAAGWSQLTVTARHATGTSDSIRLTIDEIQSTITYPTADWTGPATTSYATLGGIDLSLTRDQDPELLTGTARWSASGQVLGITQQPARFGGRPVARCEAIVPDALRRADYAPGLGYVLQINSGGVSAIGRQTVRLIGYVKNNGALRWGDTRLPQPLAAPTALGTALHATLSPTVAGPEADARLTLAPAQPTTATLALYDGLGRVMWQQQAAVPGGEQVIAVPTRALAPGIYRLRVQCADGRHCTLPLLR